MAERLELYKCEVCGTVTEVIHEGADSLVCCGEPMKLQEEKTEEELNNMLQKAVENEAYEEAARIRNEIERRKSN